MTHDHFGPEPTREEVESLTVPVLLEFGTEWCGHCRSLGPDVETLLADYPTVRHIKVEDGPGRPLGRGLRVKLWPTLVFFRDGVPLMQLTRPLPGEVRDGLEAITGTDDPTAKSPT